MTTKIKAILQISKNIYQEFGFLTRAIIIGHYTGFYGLTPISSWLQLIYFS